MRSFNDIKSELPKPKLTELSEEHSLENLFISGQSPCLVFIHGGGGNLWNPYYQLDDFNDRYSMLTYNLAGYGESSYRSDQSLEDHVEDLKMLLDSHDIEEVVLHGHSYGTIIALEYAKKYSTKGVVLTSGGAYNLTPDWEKPMLKLLLKLRLYKIPLNKWLMKKLAGIALSSETSDSRVEDFLKSNPMPHRRSAWETIVNSFWEYSAENLEHIESPTLVLHGPEDGIVPIDAARRTAEALPNSEFQKIPNTGHVPMAEKPEKYNELLEEFLSQIDG